MGDEVVARMLSVAGEAALLPARSRRSAWAAATRST